MDYGVILVLSIADFANAFKEHNKSFYSSTSFVLHADLPAFVWLTLSLSNQHRS